jgi:hypothetical protein
LFPIVSDIQSSARLSTLEHTGAIKPSNDLIEAEKPRKDEMFKGLKFRIKGMMQSWGKG